MDHQALTNLRARTDAKILYAEIHLAELGARGTNGSSDFDRSFQESFLFHLLGAKDAFLMELNKYYSGDIAESDLSAGELRRILKDRGLTSSELVELYTLENDGASWLFHAKEMRDHSTHVGSIPRAFHMGGPNHGKVFLRNPTTGEHVERHFLDAFAEWVGNMRTLLERLRATAIATMHST